MDAQSTSTQQNLSNGPADMPDRGSGSIDAQSTSSNVPLARNAHPVAAFGARPSQGEIQCNSTHSDLSRKSDGPYANRRVSETTPETSFGGKGKR